MTRALTLILLSIGVPGLLSGQDDPISSATRRAGFELQGVTVSSGYYTSGTPVGFEVPTQNLSAGPTALLMAAISVGGQRSGEKSTLTWNYSPSYFSTVYSNSNSPNYGSVNHRLSVNWSRKLGSKWTLTTSVTGVLASLEQLYFASGSLSSVAAVPTTFDELAAAILAGKYTNAQLAALLTGAPLQASPEQSFPYGTRIMSAATAVGLAWAPTGRTTISVNLSGARTQSITGAGTTGTNPVSGAVLPQMTTAAAALSWSYALSPRTQIGVQATSTRTFSRNALGYASTVGFSIGRTLSRRWFVQAKGGGGTITYSYLRYEQPKVAQYLFGGSIGFKTASNTLLAAYDRNLGDTYGLGSGTTGDATAAWNWRRPGSGWSASASASYQQLNNPTFRNTRSWRVQAGLSRSLTQTVALSWQYIYFQIPESLAMVGQNNSENGVLVSLAWTPRSR